MQLWQFIEVRDAAIRRELKAVSWDQDQVVDASHYVVVGVRRDVSEDDSDRHIRRMCEVRGLAPESLQAYKKKFKEFYGSKDSVEAVSWVDRQSYIALGFAMFAAAGLGVDTCAIEGISDTKEYDRILGLEGTPYRAICGLAFGYRNPADRYASIPKVRYKEEDVYRVI